MIGISEGLGAVLAGAKKSMRPITIEQCTQLERLELAANIALGVLGEVRVAYAEQTSILLARYGRAPHYRLTWEDLVFAERWARSLAYRAALAAWHAEPENRAAAAAVAACTTPEQAAALPDEVKTRMAGQPRAVVVVTLRDAPDGWPEEIVGWSWSETFSRLLEQRRRNAGAPLFVGATEREPGDDDPDVAGGP